MINAVMVMAKQLKALSQGGGKIVALVIYGKGQLLLEA